MAKKEKKVAKIPFKKRGPVKFRTFSFGATIPTQSFGNVTPRIEVEAENYEDARDFAIPKIEELYEKFCEVKPVYMGRITVTEKVVTAPEKKEEVKEKVDPAADVTAKPKSEAVMKAEKAIGLAMTEEAANTIQDQIERSVKIDKDDKPLLYTLCLKKKKELAAKL